MTPAIRRAFIAIGCTAMALSACTSTISGQGSGAPPAATPTSSGAAPGTSVPSSPAPSASVPSVTVPGGGDNAALSATELEQAAKAALTSATSFRMTGTGSDGSIAITFDIHYGESSSRGTLTLNGQRVQLLNSGPDIYMKAGRKFWEQFAGAAGGSVIQLLQGKWVHIPPGNPGLSDLADIAVRQKFLANAAASPDSSTYTNGPARTIDGVPAVSFVSSDDGSIIYVPAQGTPFPIRIQDNSDSGGSFDLGGWNVPFTAAPLPSDQIIELPG
jgi:hypothetical protein